MASNDLLAELQQTLQQLEAASNSQQQQQDACSSGRRMLAAGAAAPTISYSHYPFSTVGGGWSQSSHSRSSSSRADAFIVDEDSFAASAAAEAAAASVQGLGDGGRALAALLGRYDVAAHLSGHLHDLMGPHMFTKYAKRSSGNGPTHYLLDLEVRPVVGGRGDALVLSGGYVGKAWWQTTHMFTFT
jgi:hypothetical protein